MKKTLHKKILTLSLMVLSLAFVIQAVPVHAALDYSGLVKCDGVVDHGNIKTGEPGRQTVCDFGALTSMVSSIINWLFYISIPIATALFAWAGVLHMTGNPGNIKKSWAIFQAVAIGFIIMLTAWFMISTIIKWFATSNSGATTLIEKQN